MSVNRNFIHIVTAMLFGICNKILFFYSWVFLFFKISVKTQLQNSKIHTTKKVKCIISTAKHISLHEYKFCSNLN